LGNAHPVPGQVTSSRRQPPRLNPANVYIPPTSQVQGTQAMPQQQGCWNCKQMGHAGSDCPKIQCFNCGNLGHISSL
jgi:hypothetical protein